MRKKILIVNQNSGYLTVDVANSFVDLYDEVVVMYGINRVTERNFHPSIKIQKTFIYNRSSSLKRLFTWITCTLHLTILLIYKYRKYKILYYSNPPMSYFNSLIFSNSFSIVVFDSYPDALKLIGIKEKSIVYRIWKLINIRVFKKAEQIITLSDGMKQQLQQYVDEKKIKVVSVWSASDYFKPIAKESNSFIKNNNLQDKFIVLYSGNMGFGHKLEVLIDLAENLKNHKQIHFLFVGEGAKKITLMKLVKQKNLNNVSFLTWQDSSIMAYSLAAGDIAVVALEHDVTNASVPSKTFNYMAVGAPILAIGSPGSELEKLIIKHEIGFYTRGEELNEIEKYVLRLLNNKNEAQQISLRSFNASKLYNHSQSIKYVF